MTIGLVAAALAVAVVAVALIGPARLWSFFGPADLGTIDFATLTRRASPNDALACPAAMCAAKADLVPPVFAIGAPELRNAMAKALAAEPRLDLVASDAASLTDRYVQRSVLLGFPDTIVIRYLELPGSASTVAIYSRSKLGRSDFGVNRARIERWLRNVQEIVSAR